MRRHDQSAAGSLIAAARFHTDKTVLYQIDTADSIRSANIVQRFEQVEARVVTASIDRDGPALLETDGHVGGFIRGLLSALGQHPDLVGSRIGWILERAPLV